MEGHLSKNLALFQFQVISISGTWSMLPQVQVLLFLFLQLLISFLHITYPAFKHITSFSLSPYPFAEVFYTVLRWCFLYHNLVFSYFSIEFFGIRLKDIILPVKFVTFIKSSFPLCFYLYFLLFELLFDTWNMRDICDFVLSYNVPSFSCFLDLYSFLFR